MDTNTRIEALERAVAEIATYLAFSLRHIESLAKAVNTDDVRLSDQHRILQTADHLAKLADSLRP